MIRKTGKFFFLAFLVILASMVQNNLSAIAKDDDITLTSLESGFTDPPLQARPRGYWAWINGNVSLPQLTRELEEMKDKGLGGLDIFDIGARDPKGIIPDGPAFLGPESVEAIGHAVREAARLGLEIGFLTSSSWNAGGPWIKPENGAKGIFSSQIRVAGPKRITQTLPFPKVPDKSPKTADGLPAYYKDIALIAVPYSENKTIHNFDSLIDLTGRLDSNSRLEWDAPAGEWEIIRYICAGTGETLVLPSPNSKGSIIDHFDPAATEFHFRYMIDTLQEELGPLGKTAMTFMYLPSYEVTSYEKEKGLVWTTKLREEFERLRGYDLTIYLPLLFGYTCDDKEIADRFLFDFNMTLSDLIIEGHYMKAREICNKEGLLLCSEAGGPGQPLHNCPFEALRALGALDVPRGEFWYKHQRFDDEGNDIMWLVKEIACASHIYGKTLVDGEAFTSWYHWQNGPFDLKPLADQAMCEGLNRFTFHTGAHCPPEAGLPGWAYHAGTHINVTRVWWPKIGPFIDYLARCCYLLQQGHFVGDVCYYYGDQAPNFVKPKHIDPSLGPGYDYDVVNTEVILSRLEEKNGRLVLPDGMSYEILVLPERDDINLDVLKKLERLIEQGATVVGPKPSRSNGLYNYIERDTNIKQLADKLWGSCDGTNVKENKIGKGKIFWGRSLRDVMQEKGIGPDFTYTTTSGEDDLDFIHRKTKEEDIYFVSNKTNEWIEAECFFRVKNKSPELWDPSTGERIRTAVYQNTDTVTKTHLRLPPSGSVFVVFQEKADKNHFVATSLEPSSSSIALKNNDSAEICIRKADSCTFKTNQDILTGIKFEAIPVDIEIKGPWDLRFPYGWGAPPIVEFPELISWTESADDGIKYFSGITAYRKTFELPASYISNDMKLVLDLGVVKDIADVYLNGKSLGILWKPPFQVDITDAAKPGENRLVVEVANQWSNRIVGDALHPGEKQYTRTNITYSIMWERSWKDTPLLESGLLGPVRILPAKKVILQIPE